MHKYTQNILIIYLLIGYQENNWIGTTQHELTVRGSFRKLTDSVCTHLHKTKNIFENKCFHSNSHGSLPSHPADRDRPRPY